MMKKVIPFIIVSGLVLGGCGKDGKDAVPNKDETPMEYFDDRVNDRRPEVDERQTGPNMDGVQDRNNRTEDGIINETNRNADMNGDRTTNPDDRSGMDENRTSPENGTMKRDKNLQENR